MYPESHTMSGEAMTMDRSLLVNWKLVSSMESRQQHACTIATKRHTLGPRWLPLGVKGACMGNRGDQQTVTLHRVAHATPEPYLQIAFGRPH